MHPTQSLATGTCPARVPAPLHWTFKPSIRSRSKAKVAASVIALATFCALALFHSAAIALVVCAILVAAVADRFLPLTYQLNEDTAQVKIGTFVWLEMAWRDVASVTCIPGGVKLSPYVNPATARLEARRGVRLIYPASRAAEVEAELCRLIAASREAVDAA
jgi:hypothetical protein